MWYMAEDEKTAQHLVIENLYAELEKEREASATAAAEVLSMISRLQGEKAAQKMEASQYKRLVEGKTRHAEELLVIFDELLHQKEMEIDSLKFQVQDYVDKLSGIVSNSNTSQLKNSANQFLNGSDSFLHERGCNELVRRNSSHPVLETEGLCSQMDSMDESSGKLKQVIAQECSGQMHRRLSIGSHNSSYTSCSHCFQQGEEIKEKTIDSSSTRNVGETSMVQCTLANNKPQVRIPVDSWNATEGCMSFPRKLSISDQLCKLNAEELGTKGVGLFCQDKFPNSSSDWDASSSSCLENASCRNNTTPMNTHDIFEVPQYHSTLSKLRKLYFLKPDLEDNGKPELINPISKEATDYSYKDDLINKGIVCSCRECELHASRKQIIPAGLQHVWSHRIDSAPPWFDGNQFEMRLQKLEDRIITQHEDFNREGQMKLLREIHEKLNTIQSCICAQRTKKQNRQDGSLFFSLLEEAMLSFSI